MHKTVRTTLDHGAQWGHVPKVISEVGDHRCLITKQPEAFFGQFPRLYHLLPEAGGLCHLLPEAGGTLFYGGICTS